MNPGFLVGAGFLLGSVGLKAATSKKAKKIYVKGIVQGMRAKEEVETMIDEARAEFDDLLAEAGYVKEFEEGEEAVSADDAEANTAEDNDTEEAESSAQSEKKTKAKKTATDDAVKQVAKAVSAAAKTATGKGAGKGGRGHGHGRAGK